jgi:phage tail-like protein
VSTTNGDFSNPIVTGPGFGTVRSLPSVGIRPPPCVASERAYLRSGLPAIYQEDDDDFGMRFLNALETLLDPTVALLDALPAHFDPELAPADVLELIMAWLGLELREVQTTSERREIVRMAAELGRQRGTKAGLELALRLGFPGVPFRVEDGGAVVWSTDPGSLPETPPPSFVVYCDAALREERQAEVARLIEQVKPAHVHYRLRVRVNRPPSADEGASSPS